MLQTMLANPTMGVAVLVVAFLLCKVFKVVGKAFKIVMCIAIAYAAINFLGLF